MLIPNPKSNLRHHVTINYILYSASSIAKLLEHQRINCHMNVINDILFGFSKSRAFVFFIEAGKSSMWTFYIENIGFQS